MKKDRFGTVGLKIRVLDMSYSSALDMSYSRALDMSVYEKWCQPRRHLFTPVSTPRFLSGYLIIPTVTQLHTLNKNLKCLPWLLQFPAEYLYIFFIFILETTALFGLFKKIFLNIDIHVLQIELDFILNKNVNINVNILNVLLTTVWTIRQMSPINHFL